MVLDCSVAVEVFIGRSRARERLASSTAFAPHLIDAEVLQAIRGLARGGHLSLDTGERFVDGWPRVGVVRFAMHPLLPRMWALRDDLTAYDASDVALAEELGLPLVTADERLARAPGVGCDVQLLDR